jgi:hypothetical protein
MNAGDLATKILLAHPILLVALTTLIGLSIVASKIIAPRWPIPPATAPWWKKALHFALVNWPAWGATLGDEVKSLVPGTTIPFVSFTVRTTADPVDKAREVLNERPPRSGSGDVGSIDIMVLACIGLVGFIIVFVLSGCDGFKAPAYETLTVMVKSADAARAELPEACKLVETKAVEAAQTKAEARDTTDAIHNRCEAALTGLEAVGKSAKVARDGVRDTTAALKDPKALLGWARAAVDAYKNMSALLAEFAVVLPKIPGVN